MRSGVDYSFGRPDPAALTSADYSFAVRYLSYSPNSKNLSKDEAEQLHDAGIDVVSNWEYYGDWEHDFSGGEDTGRAHALEAHQLHLSCGGPPDRPIYFSVDFDVTPDQQGAVDAYFDGVASVLGLERCGAYGGYRVIKHLFDAGKIRWGWQTFAWSGGQWEPRAHLRQVQANITVDGVSCDADEAQLDDFGQWGPTPIPTPVPGPPTTGHVPETTAKTITPAPVNLVAAETNDTLAAHMAAVALVRSGVDSLVVNAANIAALDNAEWPIPIGHCRFIVVGRSAFDLLPERTQQFVFAPPQPEQSDYFGAVGATSDDTKNKLVDILNMIKPGTGDDFKERMAAL